MHGRRFFRTFLRALLSGLALTLATAAPSRADTLEVAVFDNDFAPDPTIRVGDTIRWVWQQGSHSTTSVTGSAESWDSGVHNPAFSFEHTFNNVGVFHYYCRLHGSDTGNGTAVGMAGKITVESTVDLRGNYAGTLMDEDGSVVSAMGLTITSLRGSSFRGTASMDGVNFTPVRGSITPAGEIRFTQKVRVGRSRTRNLWRGQFSEDGEMVTGTINQKAGRTRTEFDFTANKQPPA